MTTDRELMQQALDALEGYARNCKCEGGGAPCDAAEALRARLAQPEQRSEQWWRHEVSNAYANGYEKGRASVKQPEQEPVAWTTDIEFDRDTEVIPAKEKGKLGTSMMDIPLYTAPPQREWQWLTDEEYEAMAEKHVTNYFFDTLKYAHAIEAKLNEKNA